MCGIKGGAAKYEDFQASRVLDAELPPRLRQALLPQVRIGIGMVPEAFGFANRVCRGGSSRVCDRTLETLQRRPLTAANGPCSDVRTRSIRHRLGHHAHEQEADLGPVQTTTQNIRACAAFLYELIEAAAMDISGSYIASSGLPAFEWVYGGYVLQSFSARGSRSRPPQ